MQYNGVPTPGEQVIPNAHNLIKIIILFAILFIAFIAGHYGAIAIEEAMGNTELLTLVVKWNWLLFCGAIASSAVQGLGILAHDAVHKVLFSKLWINDLVAGLISAFAMLPFNANRQFHLAHHRFSHQKKLDPEEPMHNHSLLFSLTVGSVIGLLLQYQIFIVNFFTRLFSKRYFLPAIMDLFFISLAMGCYFIFLPLKGIPIEHSILPMLLVLPLIFGVRAISDHYGLPAAATKEERAANGKKDEDVSGWVIITSPILEWMWSAVNFHEVHHKFPYLSHSYLRSTYIATREQLPYVVANGYLKNCWRHLKRDYYGAKQPKSDATSF